MCTPFTRSVYLILDQFIGKKNRVTIAELESAIVAYNWSAELRTNRQLVQRTLEYLLRDGSVRRTGEGIFEISERGTKARNAARQFAAAEPEAA